MVGAIHRPVTIEELATSVREAASLRVSGLDTHAAERDALQAKARLELSKLTGIVDYEPRDQVIVVRAGTPLVEVATAVQTDGFWISGHGIGSVGGAVSVGDQGRADWGWRDCVLGMRVVLADGRIVQFGSRAVKNVAGYDGHKLLIGARGTLGVIAEIILRLSPGERPPITLVPGRSKEPITDPTVAKYMRRAKDLFDPTHKLNPGEMGIF